jgi:quercetin dioxygenase-like cupin family protein
VEKKVGIKKGSVVELTKTIPYAKNSIVSKILLDKKAGTLTLFAFDEGQGLSEHTAPFDAVVEVLEGEALLTIGGKTVIAAAGTMTIMPADIPHSLRAEKKFKMLLTMIR